MVLVMAFILTSIVTVILFHRCSTLRMFLAMMFTAITTVLLMVCCLVMLGSYGQVCTNIKEKQLHAISEYEHSAKSEQDWQWLVEHIEMYNDEITAVIDNDDMYQMLDILYIIVKNNTADTQCITLSEDGYALRVPDSYDIISPYYSAQ